MRPPGCVRLRASSSAAYLALLLSLSAPVLMLRVAAQADTTPLSPPEQPPEPLFWLPDQPCLLPSDCPASQFCGSRLLAAASLTDTRACLPCWRACLECADAKATTAALLSYAAGCAACNCAPSTAACISSSTCASGSFCPAVGRSCTSCYACVNNADSVEGDCVVACGTPPRSSLPALVNLPYNAQDETQSRWTVVSLLEGRDLFQGVTGTGGTRTRILAAAAAAATGGAGVNLIAPSLAVFSQVVNASGLTSLPDNQLQYMFKQLDQLSVGSVSMPQFVAYLGAARDSYPLFCPDDADLAGMNETFPGCACLVPLPLYYDNLADAQADLRTNLLAQTSSSTVNATGNCPAGYLCSVYAFKQLRHVLSRRSAAAPLGYCVPCTVGEYCPAGVVEKTFAQLSNCSGALSELNTIYSSTAKESRNTLLYESCRNDFACPSGTYCPDPSSAEACTSGSFCGEGVVVPTDCNLEELAVYEPYTTIQDAPKLLLYSLLADHQQPLDGNVCPAGSADPFKKCRKGYYCPDPSRQLICPKGRYCPSGTSHPIGCNFLLDCNKEGLDTPTIIWWGFVVFIVIVISIPIAAWGIKRWRLSRVQKAQRQDNLLEFMGSLGFDLASATEGAPTYRLPGEAPPALGGGSLWRRVCDGAWWFHHSLARWGMAFFETCIACQWSRFRRAKEVEKELKGGMVVSAAGAASMRRAPSSRSKDSSGALSGLFTGKRGGVAQTHPLESVAEAPGDGPYRSSFGISGPVAEGVMRPPSRQAASRPICEAFEGGPSSGGSGNGDGGAYYEAASGAADGGGGASGGGGGEQAAVRGFNDIDVKVSIEFQDLGLHLKSNGQCVLRDVTGTFPHSTMNAIMGPSGSGKTTCMTTLSGRASYGHMSGIVNMYKGNVGEGKAYTFEKLRYLSGFVPQDDIVHETLTVRENLAYSSMLRLPNDTTLSEKSAVVREVIQLLGMRHVQHSIVGSVAARGISGGQRKRVNIGVELAARPSLLFLDEPTSGLDSAVSQDILSSLKHMAGMGMNINMVIHQPRYSIFEMFDTVLLLGEGGITVYLGPVDWMLKYFTFLGFPLPPLENPADFYLDVISGAVSREGDEDFVSGELFTVWSEVGAAWLALEEKEAAASKLAERDSSSATSGGSGWAPTPGVATPGVPGVSVSDEEQGEALAAMMSMLAHKKEEIEKVLDDLRQQREAAKRDSGAGASSSAGSAAFGGRPASAVSSRDGAISPKSPVLSPAVLGEKLPSSIGEVLGSARRAVSALGFLPSPRPGSAHDAMLAERNDAVHNLAKGTAVPWRPKDLQAIHDRFDILDVDGENQLTLPKFITFWEGLRRVLPPDQYRKLVHDSIAEFNLQAGSAISRDEFMAGIKTRLLLAALTPEQRAGLPQLQLGMSRVQLLEAVCHNSEDIKGGQISIDMVSRMRHVRNLPGDMLARVGNAAAKTAGKTGRVVGGAAGGAAAGVGGIVGDAAAGVMGGINTLKTMASVEPGEDDAPGTPSGAFSPRKGLLLATVGPRVAYKGARGIGRAVHNQAYIKAARRSVYEVALDSFAAALGREVGGRALPSLWEQIAVVWLRCAAKWLNATNILFMDIALVVMLGLLLGVTQGHKPELSSAPAAALPVVLAFVLLSTVAGLRSFGNENVIFFQREAHGGVFTIAHAMGHMLWDMVTIALYPAIYMGFYYSATVFNILWIKYYFITIALCWYGTGVGYIFSVTLSGTNAQLAGLTFTLVFGGIINGVSTSLGQAKENLILRILLYISYARWAVEAIVIGTMVPVTTANALLTTVVLDTIGFCGFADAPVATLLDGLTSPSNTTAVSDLLRQISGAQTNGTFTPDYFDMLNNNLTGNPLLQSVVRLYETGEYPAVLQARCQPYWWADLGWLCLWGVIFRVLTFLVLLLKVWVKSSD